MRARRRHQACRRSKPRVPRKDKRCLLCTRRPPAIKLRPRLPIPIPMPARAPRRLSPSRLNDFLGCEHRTYLDLLADKGEIPREEYAPPNAQLLFERGIRHEEEFLQSLRDEGRDVVSLG